MAQLIRPADAQGVYFEEVLRLPIEGLCAMALSPDGTRIAVKRYLPTETFLPPAERQVELAVYATQTGKKSTVLHAERGSCSSIGYINNTLMWQGQYLVAAFVGKVLVWRADKPTAAQYSIPLGTNFWETEPSALALNPSAERLVVRDLADLVLYDLATGRPLTRWRAVNGDLRRITMLVWSPNGNQLLVSDSSTITVVDFNEDIFADRNLVWKEGNRLQAIGWLGDAVVLTVERLGFLRFRDASSGRQLQEVFLKGAVAAFSPDQRWVASVDVSTVPIDASNYTAPENAIKVFSLPAVTIFTKLPFEMSSAGGIRCLQLAFSADGTHLAAIIDENNPTLYVWARRE